MIVKMKFLSISGPRTDIDRVCEKYLSKYEMQLENAVTELKTTDNLLPFIEVNPYKDALAKAEQFAELLPENGCLIINGQIENPDEITHNLKCPVVTFGPDDNSDYHPADIHYNSLGCPTFTLYGPGNRERQFTLQVPGEHNIYNAKADVALCRLRVEF